MSTQLRGYNQDKFKADALAGFTVAVTLIPQGLAYGSLARLPVQYGLYSGFVGGFIYLLFGTAKDITLGPTAIMSLFVAQYCNGSIHLAGAMTFYSGLVLVFVFAFLGIGGCISDFISQHVITGFCAAASFITTITQIPKVLGLKVNSRQPIGILQEAYLAILANDKDNHVNIHDLFMGLFSIFALNIMKNLPTISKRLFAYESRHLKTISTARNAILAFTLAFFTYSTCYSTEGGAVSSHQTSIILDDNEELLLSDDGALSEIHHGHSKGSKLNAASSSAALLQDPDSSGNRCGYTLIAIDVEDGSSGIKFHEPELTLSNLKKLTTSGALFIIPFMAFLESISIARTFGKQFGYRPDEFWESFAIGMSNIVGSFFGSFPVTGSFSRTALNASTGVKTTLGGIVTSFTVIFALELMLGVFHYIPKACLGAIIICAAAHMFDPIVLDHGRKLFLFGSHHFCHTFGIHPANNGYSSLGGIDSPDRRRSRKSSDNKNKTSPMPHYTRSHSIMDANKDVQSLDGSLACFVTFLVCFYGLAIGILLGLGVSVASILYKVSHPLILSNIEEHRLIIKTTADTLSYSSCNYVYSKLQEIFVKSGLLDDEGRKIEHRLPSQSLKKNDSDLNLDINMHDHLLDSTTIRHVIIDISNVRNLDNDVYSVLSDYRELLQSMKTAEGRNISCEIKTCLS